MRLNSLKILICLSAYALMLPACQRSPGLHGGIVDNGNKTTNPTGPASPTQSDPTGGKGQQETSGSVNQGTSSQGVLKPAHKILGNRYHIAYLPGNLMIRESSETKTDLVYSPEAAAAVTFALDNVAWCEQPAESLLLTSDGGILYSCIEQPKQFVLHAKNQDVINIANESLEKEQFLSIIRSFASEGTQ